MGRLRFHVLKNSLISRELSNNSTLRDREWQEWLSSTYGVSVISYPRLQQGACNRLLAYSKDTSSVLALYVTSCVPTVTATFKIFQGCCLRYSVNDTIPARCTKTDPQPVDCRRKDPLLSTLSAIDLVRTISRNSIVWSPKVQLLNRTWQSHIIPVSIKVWLHAANTWNVSPSTLQYRPLRRWNMDAGCRRPN